MAYAVRAASAFSASNWSASRCLEVRSAESFFGAEAFLDQRTDVAPATVHLMERRHQFGRRRRMVRMTSFAPGLDGFSRRAASMPFRPGMEMSSRMLGPVMCGSYGMFWSGPPSRQARV